MKGNFRKLAFNRIDLVISNIYVGDSTIEEMGMVGEFKKLAPVVQAVDSFIAFSKVKKLTKLRDEFDAEFEKISSEEIHDIMQKYGITN